MTCNSITETNLDSSTTDDGSWSNYLPDVNNYLPDVNNYLPAVTGILSDDTSESSAEKYKVQLNNLPLESAESDLGCENIVFLSYSIPKPIVTAFIYFDYWSIFVEIIKATVRIPTRRF